MHWLVRIVAISLLVAVVTGCGGAGRYDARLVAADSLMQPDPDSALALVQAVPPGSLTREGDRAYRDLLLTQARYKCYITATSDSDINRALDYYRRHSGEREKLTRAYIYKGAVMEELNHPDSAMFYYKHAEATAAPTDYFNLGYTKMRMGALYRDNYSMDGKHIEKYEEALECFKKIGENGYQLRCMINLGSIYRLKMPDKSVSILSSAQSYALQLNDTVRYISCLQNLIQTYYVQAKYDSAHTLINEVLSLRQENYDFDFCTNAADVFARLGKPDSAELVLNMFKKRPFTNVIEEMLYMESIGEIALARGDSAKYLLMESKCMQKQDSVQALGTPMKIMKMEEKHNQAIQQKKHQHHHITSVWLMIVIISLISAITLFCYFYYRRNHRYDKLIADLRATTDSHIQELENLQNKIKDLDFKDKKLEDYFDSHLWLMREVIEECYNVPNDKLVRKLQDIFSCQEQNQKEWMKLNNYIDMRYHHILSDTRKQFPQLNEREIMLLALTIMDFSCIQITMVLGYSNPTSVGVIRKRLANKMGLKCSLKQYIEDYMQKHT